MLKCRVCDYESETGHGLAIHYARNDDHPDSVPGDIDTSRTVEDKEAISQSVPSGEDHALYGKTGKQHPARKTGKDHPMYGKEGPMRGKFGSEHPRWEGGREEYPDGWNAELKELVRQLYFRRCQLCGVHEEQTGRKHDVHHWDGNKDNISLNNLFPFCKSCHKIVEWQFTKSMEVQ